MCFDTRPLLERKVTKVVPGDHVTIEPGFPCRRCRHCKAGKYNICPEMKFAANPPNDYGTVTRLFRTPEDFVYLVLIPEAVSLQEGVLMEPLSVAVHGCRLAGITPGRTFLLQGSGTIGLLAAKTARAFGAKEVYVSDINQIKLEFAKRFIECRTFLPDTIKAQPQHEAERMKNELDLGEEADVVLECTGAESSVQTGIYASGPGGVVVQIGLGKPDVRLSILI